MRSFLVQPYPFSDNVRNKLAVCGGIGLFVALFLALFEPFGFDELPTALKWQHALAFGAVTFLVACFFQIVLPRLLPFLFREEGWRSWKEILYLLLTTLVVGAGNYGLMLYLYPQEVEMANFFRAELITLQVGIFPILFVVFMKQMTLYRRYVAEAREVTQDIREGETSLPAPPPIPALPQLVLKGDNQKEELTLFPDDLLFVTSADNYVKVQFRKNGDLQAVILRSTLKKIEEQLTGHPQFFRCHRMYLANLQAVKHVSGNAQGLKLHLPGLEEAIPVSRSFTEVVRKKLHQLSIRPKTPDNQYHSPLLLVSCPKPGLAVPRIWISFSGKVIFVKTEIDMSTLITVLLILHVVSGFTALITGGIASFTHKGGKRHRLAGRWYFWAMTGVFVTAVAVSVLKGRLFLFMVGFFSYYFVVRGYRLLYLKGLGRTQKAQPIDWVIMSSALVFGLSQITFAMLQKMNGNSFWPVPMVFGSVSAGFALADIRLFVNGPKTKQHWITGHIASMGAGYIATWTAFVVTNVKFLPPVFVWLAPPAIGAVLIGHSIRRYSKPKKAPKLAVSSI